ncbi:MAG: Ig-like domain-containing protein [Lentihominibacter sp.]
MFTHKKPYITAVLICIIMALTAGSVFADNGDGTGDGDGQGLGENKSIPLTLVKSSVADGASDVALNETVQLDFNKNICNITVLANNKMCFHLTGQDGEAVPIRLIFPDDQVQHDYKKQVFIIPQTDLDANSEYRISVDSTLLAKNGTMIDNAHTITFTTGTHRTDSENKVLKKLDDYTVTYETAYNETEDSVPVNKEDLDDISEDRGINTVTIARIAAAAIIAVIIVFTAVLIIIRRRK